MPRYRYQVQRFSPSNTPITPPNAFNITFETASTTKSIPLATGDWATHPAFTFGTTELNGIWVGKFETSYGNVANSVNETKYSDVYIKPNQYSLTNQSLSNQFLTAQDVWTQHNLTALTDTRMMRNDDWGAVTYLTTSAYGIGANEVWVNNANVNNFTIAGRAGNSVGAGSYTYPDLATAIADTANTNPYYNAIGPNASSTGNVYGVYDMSGGAWENTLSNYNKSVGSSGFSTGAATAFAANGTDIPDKYFNFYMNPPFTGSQYTDYNLCIWSTCGGQALYETTTVASVSGDFQSWFGSLSLFVSAGWPGSVRGGGFSSGSSSGLFANGQSVGVGYSYFGFRMVQSKF